MLLCAGNISRVDMSVFDVSMSFCTGANVFCADVKLKALRRRCASAGTFHEHTGIKTVALQFEQFKKEQLRSLACQRYAKYAARVLLLDAM